MPIPVEHEVITRHIEPMNIYVNGKDLVVGAPLSSLVETQFHSAVTKYLDHALDAI